MRPTVIDLGELPAAQIQQEPVRRRAVRRYPRVWICVAALLALLALGGATRPSTALADTSTVDFRTGRVFQLAGDQLYVLDQPLAGSTRLAGQAAPPMRLTSYALPSDRPLWSASLPWQVERLVLARAAGVLLAVGPDVTPSLTAVDLATGRVRWHNADHLIDVSPDGRSAAAWVRFPSGMAVVDLSTGVWIWSEYGSPADPAENTAATVSTVDAEGRWFVVARSPGGQTVAVDTRNGGAGFGRLPAPPEDSPTNPGPAVLGAVGNLLTVRYRSLDWGVVDGYDLTSLTPRWHLTLASNLPYLNDCGRLICVGGERDGLFAVDPTDGRVVWADGRRNEAVRLTAGPPGRLLAYLAPFVSEVASQQVAVLDAATGRSLLDLGDGWWPEFGSAGDQLLLGRPNGDATTTFVALDLATLARRPLGTLPVLPFTCQASDRYLVCPTADDSLHIWRYWTSVSD